MAEKEREGGAFRLILKDARATKRTFQRLLRKYAAGEIDKEMHRTLVYGLSVYLGYLKLERESDMLDDFAKLQEQVSDLTSEVEELRRRVK